VAFLFNLAASLPARGNYLEVGSWMGLSSIIVANGLLANVNLDARVWCVDTWEGSAEHQVLDVVKNGGLYETFRRNVEDAQMEHFIQPLRGPSTEVARRWQGPPLDLIFVDGDHSAAGCYADLRAWRPLLAPGGRMLGHDATPGGGVRTALTQYAAETGVRFHLHEPPTAHYIWEMIA
jgi:predicted O-methyltransferase YrrM